MCTPDANGPTTKLLPHPDQLEPSSEYRNDDVSGAAVVANVNVPYEPAEVEGGVVTNDGMPGDAPFSSHDTDNVGAGTAASSFTAHSDTGTTRSAKL